MTIKINTPTGVYNFPDGTSEEVMRSAIMSHIDGQKTAQYQQKLADSRTGGVSGIARGVVQNLPQALLGFGDEITSGVTAAALKGYDKAQNFLTGGDELFSGRGVGDLYNEAQGQQRLDLEAQMRDNTGTAITSQVAGGVGAFPIGGAVVGKVPIVGESLVNAGTKVLGSLGKGSLPARVAKNAAFGDVVNRAYAAGTAEGGNRLEAAKDAGWLGAGVGAALPIAGAVTRALSAPPSQSLAKLFKIDPKAAQDFTETGVQQSLAAISNSPTIGLLDRTLSKFPAAAGSIQKNTIKTLDDIEALVSAQTNSATSPSIAGSTMQKGVEGYKGRFSDVANKLYNKLDDFVRPDETIPVSNTLGLFSKKAEEFAATPALQERLSASPATKILQNISDDAAQYNGSLPYNALKRYRTEIGAELKRPELIGDADLKMTYEALSNDLKGGFTNKGDKAIAAFEKANRFYKQGAEKIDKFLQPIYASKTPEKAFNLAMGGTKDGATQLNNILRSLKPQERRIVSDTVLERLGKANAGTQNAEGSIFSANTYLTNWNKLSPEAKSALFGSDSRRVALDKIAGVVDRLKNVDRFSNPSGTAGNLITGFAGAGLLTEPLTTGSVLLGANGAARLMTNTKFVNWLAKAAVKSDSPTAINSSIRQLSGIVKSHPELTNDIARYTAVLGTILNKQEVK